MDETGFDRVVTLADARERLRELCEPHGRTVRGPVEDVGGRVLASPVSAGRDVPHYDRAAMDGYAVQAEATYDASERSPVTLRRTDGSVETGTARQVHTGSALPDGADAVAMVEYVDRAGDELTLSRAVAVGENVAPAGEDVAADEHLFESGKRLRPSDLALLRAAGIEEVEVTDRPRVSVIPTGEELVDPGTEPEPGEVVETNGLMLSSLVEQWGGDATYRDVVTDDESALSAAISRDTDHDVIVTSGGSSVGERDLLPDVLSDLGTVLVHGVDIKPGHPFGFGRVDETPILMIPGYPVSCLVNAVQFLRPAIAWSAGTEPSSIPTVGGRLREKVRSDPGERTFARVRVERADEDGADTDSLPAVEPVRTGGAGVLSSVAFADGWVVVPESREGIPAGEEVDVQMWEQPY